MTRKTILTAVLTAAFFLSAGHVSIVSAGTADGLTPSVETPCDEAGLTGSAWGLCNSYCEAKDCDYEFPRASMRSCARTLRNFYRVTDGLVPPCVNTAGDDIPTCPCYSASDLTTAMVDGCSDVVANFCDDEQCVLECSDPAFFAFASSTPDENFCEVVTEGTLVAVEISPEEADACMNLVRGLPIDPVTPVYE